jgi:heme exporter protein D
MYFDTFADFIAMGNHGLYVWMAYAFFLLVMCWNIIVLRLERRKVQKQAQTYLQRHRSANETS